MDRTPLISVIMSVYNEEEYISDAVKSILDQSEGDFEFIIIDDKSTDSTVEKIKAMGDGRIILIENEDNAGLTVNLNRALKLVRGRYIARMDGDDISLPDRFRLQVEYLKAHPDVCLISCNTMTFGEQKLVSDISGTPEELRCRMLLRPVLAHPGFMFRRELVSEYGFSYDEHFRSAQDYDLAARVTRRYGIGVVPQVLLQYRAHKGQVSQTPGLKQFKFADEIRKRLWSELGIELDEGVMDFFHSWITESDATTEVFRANMALMKRAIGAGKIYDTAYLRKTLRYQYCQWVLRSNGKKMIFKIYGWNIPMYFETVKTAFRMVASRRRRNKI